MSQAGSVVLGAGLVAAVATTLLWARVALLGVPARPARAATWTTLAMAAAACGVLEAALIGHDFSVRYVAENGGRDVPLYYTVTSLWAALDGSLLLWLLILAGCAVVLGGRRPGRAGPLRPYAMAVVGVVTVFFFALTYFAANPFTEVSPVPADGPGPNPLLREHPAMGVHPPLLYAGYIGMVVPFAYGVAALLAGRTDRLSVALMRRWTLVAWALLTGGITMGAWWSYAVLGWGGYWAWDPVENASLLPWLTATALLHTLAARRRAGALQSWTVALACGSFLLVLVGTFLTRSGAVASVHAFTASPLGPMLLGFVLVSVATVLGLLVWRSGTPREAPASPLLARDSMLTGNAVLMVALAAIVLTGTLFPLLVQAVQGDAASVGPGYFNRSAVPVALVVLLLMGVAPLLRADRAADLRRLGLPAAAGLATAAVIGLLSRPGILPLTAFALGAYVLTGLVEAALRRRTGLRRAGWLLAHAGVAVVAVGVAASSAYTVSTERQLKVGESVTAGGVTARLERVGSTAGRGEMSSRVVLELGGGADGRSEPALRYYPARDLTVSVPAIRSRIGGDVYTTVLAATADGTAATVRLAVNPLVWLVWLGGALTALGGLTAAVRLPSRRRAAVPASATGEPVGVA
ncbi:cytochrome c biogenesis protein CcsA [Couchioplanes caeruleus]|uniref:heme lyase CcmF/NrfE family subunit n=1 Tax=Couchioplanes caeruleus TaxID=56438 RepID=UPI00201C0069|nr:cytochrome c-type biogenesis CcmF C-terminal domain-containing protein [Couchioplanes caeruleus]UQU62625.1 cytochrome c biogenesis protein CcsA [Couchioplanes caeruleus]